MLTKASALRIRLFLWHVQRQNYVSHCVDVSGKLWLDGLSILLDTECHPHQ